MSDIKFEEMSQENLARLAKKLSEKVRELESERGTVAESFIKAQKVAEVIQEKAERQAEKILSDAKTEREELLSDVDKCKNELLMEIQKLTEIRSKIVKDVEKVLLKFNSMMEQELENIEEMKRVEQELLDSPVSFETQVSINSGLEIEEVTEETPGLEPPELVIEDNEALPEIKDDEISGTGLDLSELLMGETETTPAAAPEEASLESLLAATSPSVSPEAVTPSEFTPPAPQGTELQDLTPLLENSAAMPTPELSAIPELEPSNESEIQDFIKSLKVEQEGSSLNDLLAASDNTPTTSAANLEDLLAPAGAAATTPPAPQEEISDLSALLAGENTVPTPLNEASGSTSELSNSLVDVEDLLK